MKPHQFRLSTMLLLMACIAAGLATRNKRNAWYLSQSILCVLQNTLALAAFEEQDLLVSRMVGGGFKIKKKYGLNTFSVSTALQNYGFIPNAVISRNLENSAINQVIFGIV